MIACIYQCMNIAFLATEYCSINTTLHYGMFNWLLLQISNSRDIRNKEWVKYTKTHM